MQIFLSKLKNSVLGDGSDAFFTYMGKQCGLALEVKDDSPLFTVWYGDQYHDHQSFDEAINDELFDGHSISDLVISGKVTPDYD